jgi:trimethylamine--corrinoid protein Co-methyltransferase
MLLCALCGAETASGLGLRETCTLLSPEALVLDSDIYHTVRKEVAYLDTSREAMALDVIKAVGPRGHFLFQEHTRQRIRDFEFSDVADELDEHGGFRDPIEVAREKTGWILENHHPRPVPEDQKAELTRILRSADKEFE